MKTRKPDSLKSSNGIPSQTLIVVITIVLCMTMLLVRFPNDDGTTNWFDTLLFIGNVLVINAIGFFLFPNTHTIELLDESVMMSGLESPKKCHLNLSK